MQSRDKIQRLVRISTLLYQQGASKAAEAASKRAELAAAMGQFVLYLDELPEGASFLNELTLARASRMRTQMASSDAELEMLLAAAVDALAGLRGTQRSLNVANAVAARVAEQQALSDTIDGIVVRRSARLE